MKYIYIVRHGEAEANVGPLFLGETSTLTAKGWEQAEAVAERCKKLNAHVLIASTMRRAQETASAISKRTGLSIETSDLFIEREIPQQIIGKERSDPEANAIADQWLNSFYGEAPAVPGGEDFVRIHNRARKALAYLREKAEKRILLVSHGFFTRVLLAQIVFGDELTPQRLKKLSQSMRSDNTGITLVTHSDTAEHTWDDRPGWKIRVFNDHAHLG